MVKKEIKDEDETFDTSTVASSVRVPATDKDEYSRLAALVNPIAQPLAGRKLAKKIYKLIKAVGKEKGAARVGLADVQKGLRRGETGLMVLAGECGAVRPTLHL